MSVLRITGVVADPNSALEGEGLTVETRQRGGALPVGEWLVTVTETLTEGDVTTLATTLTPSPFTTMALEA